MKISRITYMLALLFWAPAAFAQLKLPSIDYAPQSPSAAAYSRYGDIPVDYSTGVPRIEIPIYTIKVGDVEVPISISYHASGIKVRDVASEVGLGFVLNYGGVVTATVVGLPDVDDAKPRGYNAYRTAQDIQDSVYHALASHDQHRIEELSWYYWNWLNPQADYPTHIDNFSDRFSYSLITGEQGVFRKDFVNDSIRLMPYRPIKIEMDHPIINIISSNGYKHQFQDVNASKDYYALKKIVNENKTDSILYYYKNYGGYVTTNANYAVTWQSEEVYLEYDPSVCGFYTPCLKKRPNSLTYLTQSGGAQEVSAPLLDSIVTKNEVLIFEYLRKDLPMDRLNRIMIKNKHTRELVKTVNFVQSFFGKQQDNNLRLRLDSIYVSGPTFQKIEKYSFAYNNKVLPPYPYGNGTLVWYEDYWGYYNGSGNSNLLPTFLRDFNIPFLPTNAYPGNMEPEGVSAMACMLTEIRYPTGGKTIFEYEPNYTSPSYSTSVGGLRIKKITSYSDESAKAFVKSYRYSDGFIAGVWPANFKYDSEEEHYVYYKRPKSLIFDQEYYSINKAFSTSLRPIVIDYGSPIVYTRVTEYFGEEATNLGKTVYVYYPPKIPEDRYSVPGDIDTRYISYYHADCGNYIPRLLEKTTYKFVNGTYTPVSSQQNTYADFKVREFNTGVSFASKIILEAWGSASSDPEQALLNYNLQFNNYPYLQSLVAVDTKGFEEVSLLTNSLVTDYTDNAATVQSTTTYSYDSNNALLKQKKATASDGRSLVSDFKYPKDFLSEPYQTMVSRNILTPLVEQSTSVQTSPTQSTSLESVTTEYMTVSPNIIMPSNVQTRKGTNAYETRIVYDQYDSHGNVLGVSKANDNKTCYIWGYNYTYPVAKIVGADYSTAYNILSAADKNALIDPAITDQQVREIIKKIRDHASMSHAMVYTYTYKPLVGITSTTDENGVTSYYEYDGFNRLQTVKDNNEDIVKTYTYHYKKQ